MSPVFPRTSDELRRRGGSPRQFARSEVFTYEDGPARGARGVRLSVAGGFDVEVLPDRGLDLGAVSWRGMPLAWLSAAGLRAPGLVEASTDGWNRGFGGGLLTTCGLDQFGRESVDDGILYPQHGRANTLVADNLSTWSEERGSDWEVGVSGVLRQSTPFAENLRLRREISCTVGGRMLRLRDRVTNDSFNDAPHMMLYHLNFGWPLISESSSLSIFQVVDGAREHTGSVIPRDEDAERGLEHWAVFGPPAAGFAEQVFRHGLAGQRQTIVRVDSPDAGVGVEVEFSSGQLPHLYQWKLLGEGAYVLGIEPANSAGIDGRSAARAAGDLPILRPGESVDYDLTLSIAPLD
jgi:hypothetical protein